MSYEGYVQYLCEKGHLHVRDCYNYDKIICSDCDSEIVWEHDVNTTNDDGDPAQLVIKTLAVYKKCEHCGETKCIEKETFEIPKDIGRPYKEPFSELDNG